MNKNLPTISFIIPIFNTEKYLVDCIESVLSQSVSKEIILIDDGSTDNSLSIALTYSQKYPFITVVHSQNGGQSAARNKGIRIAKGEYVYFVDSDDLLLDCNLEKVCHFALENNLDLVKFQSQMTSKESNQIAYTRRAHPDTKINQGVLLTGGELLSYFVKCWMPAICWSLIRREFLLKHNLFFYENIQAEDQLFYVQLLTSDITMRTMEIGNISYYYRRREGSTTTAVTDKYFLDHFKIAELIELWVNQHQFSPEIQHNIFIIMARIYQSAIDFYVKFSQERQQQFMHYITPEIIGFVQRYLGKNNHS